MEWSPPFIVPSIYIGSVSHQELHHVEVVINTGLEKNDIEINFSLPSAIIEQLRGLEDGLEL